MKTKMSVIAIIAFAVVIACGAQEVTKDYKNKCNAANQPKESWKVNKKFDDKGNLVGYDSTYSWSYSTNRFDDPAKVDSFLNTFDTHFNGQMSALFNDKGKFNFPADSFLHDQLSGPGDLFEGMEKHFQEMEKMMRQMGQDTEPPKEAPEVMPNKRL